MRRVHPALASSLGLALALASSLACAPRPEAVPEREAAPPPAPVDCPATQIHVAIAPDVEARHRDPAFWLGQLGAAADEVLIDAVAIATLNQKTLEVDGAYRDVLSDEIGNPDRIVADLGDRTAWMRKRLSAGKYVEGQPGTFESATSIIDGAIPIDELRVISREGQVFCVPTRAGIFAPVSQPDGSTRHDPDFDRNHCSSLHPGELVRVSRRSADGAWWHVHAGHSVGWLFQPDWTPALPLDAARDFRDAPPRLVPVRGDVTVGPIPLRLGVSLPILREDNDGVLVQVPLRTGLGEATARKTESLRVGAPAFSRRNLFELALSQLDAPYGWGGRDAGRDCSRFLYDAWLAFGLTLGRHSSVQAQLGTESISLAGFDEATKRQRIREAASRGVVLLYMPGHIMLYLGRDGDHDYGVSSLSEFLVPCIGGADSVYRLDRVAVTTLDLGRGTERTAFIERIDRMAVFGGPVGLDAG